MDTIFPFRMDSLWEIFHNVKFQVESVGLIGRNNIIYLATNTTHQIWLDVVLNEVHSYSHNRPIVVSFSIIIFQRMIPNYGVMAVMIVVAVDRWKTIELSCMQVVLFIKPSLKRATTTTTIWCNQQKNLESLLLRSTNVDTNSSIGLLLWFSRVLCKIIV